MGISDIGFKGYRIWDKGYRRPRFRISDFGFRMVGRARRERCVPISDSESGGYRIADMGYRGFRISDFGFRRSGISDFGFRISDLILGGLPSAVCRRRMWDFGLGIGDFGLGISDWACRDLRYLFRAWYLVPWTCELRGHTGQESRGSKLPRSKKIFLQQILPCRRVYFDEVSRPDHPKSEIRNPKYSLFLSSFLILFFLLPLAATAQTSDVVDLLVQQRTEVRIAELLEELGGKAFPRPPGHPGAMTLYRLWAERNLARRKAIADSQAAEEERAAARANALGAEPIRWRKIAAEDQGEFLDRYREVFWQSIGTPNPQDTLATSHFRARLNGLFGAPTRNAAAMEQEEYAGSEFVQFEYWLIANDSIPILVLDIDGPFGRGLLVAADEAYTDDYAAIKDDLFEKMFKSEPTPYADYYHSRERSQWYRTGFDGTEYFIREVRRPRWAARRSRDEKWRIFR